MNGIYGSETFVEDSKITYLTKIWKKKGSPGVLRNNQFMHGKSLWAKLFEKLVVALVAEQIDKKTPQLQAGSHLGR